MVNLILDTNAWIYLANGYNPDTESYEEEIHFQIVESLLAGIKKKNFRLFSNYIILIEWTRNKEKCYQLIRTYEYEISQRSKDLRKKRRLTDYAIFSMEFEKFKDSYQEKINKNKLHIQQIELILNNSIEIPISVEQKLKAVEMAIHKSPPFHHKNNSIADAIIFLSTADYFYYDEEFHIDNTIFISNNTNDFGVSVKNKKLHPHLANMLIDKPIVFETNLAKALALGNDIIDKYQKYVDYISRDTSYCEMNCKGVEYFMAEVEFDDYIEFKIDDLYRLENKINDL